MIAIVDYDMGNIASVSNMLKRIGAASVITRDPAVLLAADKIIFPGVGAFDKGMQNLTAFGLRAPLEEAVLEKKVPVLGICLGLQLLTERSEEGGATGLGWIKATTRKFRFPPGSPLKVPHMGWDYATVVRSNPLIGENDRSRFFFVHGYYIECAESQDVIATAEYGSRFTCAVARDNIFGVQFHPEKSHRFGMALLKGFVRI